MSQSPKSAEWWAGMFVGFLLSVAAMSALWISFECGKISGRDEQFSKSLKASLSGVGR